MTPILPDAEALVIAAVRAGSPGVAVRVAWPDDWAAVLPMVVASRVAGNSVRPGIDMAVIDVKCGATDRRSASLLARRVHAVLSGAATAQFAAEGGYLAALEQVSAPVHRDMGAPSPGPDLFVFQATYRVTVRGTSFYT